MGFVIRSNAGPARGADAQLRIHMPTDAVMENARMRSENLSLYHLLKRQAEQTPDAVALAAPGRKSLTYERLVAHQAYVVTALNRQGIEASDRVALLLPNSVETCAAVLGVAAGATCAPLNPAYTREELEFYLSDLRLKALIVQAGWPTPARDLARDIGLLLIELQPDTDGPAGLFSLSGPTDAESAQARFSGPEDVALVLHTSGTTSRPKIVPLTHANICASAFNSQTAFELTCNDRCLNVMPLFHVHGLISATLASLAAGGSAFCTGGYNPDSFFAWLAEAQPTWYTASPTIHQSILSMGAEYLALIKQYPLRFIRSSSAPLPPRIMAELEALFGAPVIEYYGSSEAASQITSNPMPPRQRKPGSAGVPVGQQVRIMDENGRFVAPGQIGEIVIRGPNVMSCYADNPAANAGAFVGGWLRTGDQGFFDADGYIFITGRFKEIINRGGEKISPRAVDEVLLAHPAVAQAVTFGLPHTTLGEDVAAAVVLRKHTTATERDIREFALQRLAAYRVPSQIVIVDDIPKGPTGKIQRIGLADMLASQLRPDFTAPADAIEQTLAEIWSEVLDTDRIASQDNFFVLGGDSLLATMVMSRVRAQLQIELSLEMIFREPVLDELAREIKQLLATRTAAVTEATAATETSTSAQGGPDTIERAEGYHDYTLPNGLVVSQHDRLQTNHFYREIFDERLYTRYGIKLTDHCVVFDVGANIGLFSLFVHQRCPNAHLYAFEPAPPLFEMLRINLARYEVDTELFSFGLGNRNATETFTFYPNNTGMSTFYPDSGDEEAALLAILHNQLVGDSNGLQWLHQHAREILGERLKRQTYDCQIRTLSSVITERQIPHIDLLKIDAQKSEMAILQGIDESDWARIGQIVMEVHDLEGRLNTIVDMLFRKGFTVHTDQDRVAAGSALYYLYATTSKPLL